MGSRLGTLSEKGQASVERQMWYCTSSSPQNILAWVDGMLSIELKN